MSEDAFEHQETFKDDLERFFAEPSKDNLPSVLKPDVEYDFLDFKVEWYEKSKLARDVLAFGNSGGGAIVVGVDDSGESIESVGVEEKYDPATFGDKVEGYLPDSVHELYTLETYDYGDSVYDEEVAGLDFQVVFIEGAGENSPLVSTKAGSSIKEGSIYVRRNTKSEEANHDEIQSLLEKRSEGGAEKSTAELHEELRELKTLYDEISRKKYKSSIGTKLGLSSTLSTGLASAFGTVKSNPNHPENDYEEYINLLIEKKKVRIESRLGVRNIDI